MPDIDISNLRAEIEAERQWREAEIRLLQNRVHRLESEDERRILRKALVVMLYAHFEGTCKALLSMYVDKVNQLGIRVSEATSALGAASLAEVFRALRKPNRKCRIFARQLPDDTALHSFARDRDFIEVAWTIASRSVSIDPDTLVDTEQNLKPVVLRKILFRLGLDPDLALPWEGTLHRLLNQRNGVAHGALTAGLEEADVNKLQEAVSQVVDGLVIAISAAAPQKAYLCAPPPDSPG